MLLLWKICQVAALLLLSQQEERHLLESNVNIVLQKKMEELQRNLLQVTSIWFLFPALQYQDFNSMLPFGYSISYPMNLIARKMIDRKLSCIYDYC